MPIAAAGSVSRTIALCYVRQSLTRDEMPQHSPDRQKANITALCQEHGWIPLWFVDADGHRSGYGEANRPAWQQLKDWLAHPQVVAIVANEPSRVYRQMWRMGRLMEDLDQRGVQLRFASPSSPVRDISHPADRFLLQMYALLDEHLVHDLSRRQKDAIAHRRRQGKTTGIPPFGTVRDREGYLMPSPQGAWVYPDGRMVPGYIEKEASESSALWRGYHACAARLLTLYAESGLGRARIAQQLNAEGWRFRSRKGQPRPLVDDDVRRVVANWPEYGGLVGEKRAKDRAAHYPDDAALAVFPTRAVFPLELLKTVAETAAVRRQQRRGRGRRPHTDPLLLAGLCYCGQCESRDEQEPGARGRTRLGTVGGAHKHIYRHPSNKECSIHTHSLPAELLESEVGHLIDLLCIPNDTLTALKQPFGDMNLEPVELPSEATRLKALTLYEQRLSRAKQLYLSLDIDEEEYKRLIGEYRQVINRLKAAALTPTEYALHLEYCATKMRQMQSLWQTGPNPECRAALRDLFEEFVIDLDTERITSFRLKPWADSYLRACASVFTPQAYPCGGAQPLETVGSQSKLLEGSLEAVSRVILARLYADSPSAIVLPATEVRQVRNQALRRRHAEGETLSDLAREFRISPQRVHQIVRGRKR